jgi:histidinol-phosphatase
MIGMSVSRVLSFALELADAADRVTMHYFRGDAGARQKADRSLVTRADIEVEAELRRRILERFPDHTILGEEEGYRQGSNRSARWLLDPVDGTNSFARGIPIWATLIAFEQDGSSVVGVASAPALGTRWWAGRGMGAYRASLPRVVPPVAQGFQPCPEDPLEGTRIHVSDIARVEDAQVLHGSIRLGLDRWNGRLVDLLRSAWRARSFADFWGHCLVAEGSAEVMIEPHVNPWDLAALIVIVEEAGGRLTDLDGRPTIEAGHCVTSNGALHEEVLRRLRG